MSCVLILLLLPPLCLLCAAVWLSDARSLIFKQRRMGRNKTYFSWMKIRSMVSKLEEILRRHPEENADARAEWALNRRLVDDPRVTDLKQLVRKNSLVGPRPIVEAEVIRYGEAFA